MAWFLNWNTVPMTFNDSWTYLEMLGKCVTQVDTNARNIETNRQNIEVNRQNIETNTNNIALNRADININKAGIAENKSNIASLTEELHMMYYTKEECDEKFVSGENYYDKNAIDAILTGYVDVEQLTDEIQSLTAQIGTNFASKYSVDSVARDIVSVKNKIEENGTNRYNIYTEEQYTVSDNTLTFEPVETDYDGITVHVTYTITSNGDSYNVTESIHNVRAGATKRFVMYSVAFGGFIHLENTTGNTFVVTVAKPSGTEIVVFNGLAFETFQKTKAVTQEEKQKWFDTADCNGDGSIDASDASLALSFYAWLGITDNPDNKTLDEMWIQFNEEKGYTQYNPYAPDVNRDGRADSVDASLILQFGAYAGAGGDGSVDGWYNWITGHTN